MQKVRVNEKLTVQKYELKIRKELRRELLRRNKSANKR